MNNYHLNEIEIKVYIGQGVKDVLDRFSTKTSITKKEYGGILLGRVSQEGEVFVEIATQPNNYDISNPLSFIRKKTPSQFVIERLWTKSGGKINYLGEWHTHPFLSNDPSSGDVLMIKESLKYNELVFGFMIMIITDIRGNLSITFADRKKIVTKGGLDNERLFYQF